MKYERISNGLLTLTFAVALTALSDCDRKDPQPKTELEKLPPATQEGKYTFGCLVNGNAFVTKTSLDISAVYQDGLLQISAGIEGSKIQTINFFIYDSNVVPGNYELKDSLGNEAKYLLFDKDSGILCEYVTNSSSDNQGNLELTKFDQFNLIVSGTFQLRLTNSTCEKVEITNGRFDLKFTI